MKTNLIIHCIISITIGAASYLLHRLFLAVDVSNIETRPIRTIYFFGACNSYFTMHLLTVLYLIILNRLQKRRELKNENIGISKFWILTPLITLFIYYLVQTHNYINWYGYKLTIYFVFGLVSYEEGYALGGILTAYQSISYFFIAFIASKLYESFWLSIIIIIISIFFPMFIRFFDLILEAYPRLYYHIPLMVVTITFSLIATYCIGRDGPSPEAS